MNRKYFQDVAFADPHLAKPIRQAAEAGQAKQFGVVSEAAVVGLMFPMVTYVVKNIGLPWLYELKRYSELHRRCLHDWIDEKYCDEALDPNAAEAASEALLVELETTTNPTARAAWERLVELIKSDDTSGSA